MSYFNVHKLLSKTQFGFIPGRSAMIQLLAVMDKWTEGLEEPGQIDIIYTDFEKAFDKVCHSKLISKLNSYGINSSVINWINDYLNHREFNVIVNGTLSNSFEASSGIPQGSVLGPLLFVVFINDLPMACNDNYLYLFADDAKLFRIIRSIIDAEVLNQDCKNMFEWCKNWSMNVNVSKCKVLSLHPNRSSENYDYSFQGNNSDEFLTHVEEYSDLGVLIDSKLSFKDHIHNMVNKANRNLGLIRRNFNNIDIDSFKVLYFTLVRSNLEYCHSVWNPHTVE